MKTAVVIFTIAALVACIAEAKHAPSGTKSSAISKGPKIGRLSNSGSHKSGSHKSGSKSGSQEVCEPKLDHCLKSKSKSGSVKSGSGSGKGPKTPKEHKSTPVCVVKTKTTCSCVDAPARRRLLSASKSKSKSGSSSGASSGASGASKSKSGSKKGCPAGQVQKCVETFQNEHVKCYKPSEVEAFLLSSPASHLGTSLGVCDKDECTDGTHNCNANAACTNVAGCGFQPPSFSCECNAGYSGDGVTCVDIDECATNAHNCDANAACSNTEGSFTCACNAGYSGDGVTCTDIDECATNADNCDANAACSNTEGSFTCACNTGYSGNGVTCADVDECATNADNCDAQATCENTVGSFTCTCPTGWRGDGTTCTNQCEPNPCDPLASCTPAAGSNGCSRCNQDTYGPKVSLDLNSKDVVNGQNQWADTSGNNVHAAPWNNDAGYGTTNSYSDCGKAFSGNGARDAISSFNYDISSPAHPELTVEMSFKLNSIPTNSLGWIFTNDNGGYDRSLTVHDKRFTGSTTQAYLVPMLGGAYNVHSTPGAVIPLNFGTWYHVVVVFKSTGSVNSAYATVNGQRFATLSFPAGHQVGKSTTFFGGRGSANHQTDADIGVVRVWDRELTATEIAGLYSKYECESTAGSIDYTCECPAVGYTGDGFTCTDIDECAQNPCDANAACTNTAGSFTCACNENYEGDGFTCTLIDPNECLPDPITGAPPANNCHKGLDSCVDQQPGYTCTCPAGFESANADSSLPPALRVLQTTSNDPTPGTCSDTNVCHGCLEASKQIVFTTSPKAVSGYPQNGIYKYTASWKVGKDITGVATITADGNPGAYLNRLFDAVWAKRGKSPTAWVSSVKGAPLTVSIDFGQALNINRIRVYPYSILNNYALSEMKITANPGTADEKAIGTHTAFEPRAHEVQYNIGSTLQTTTLDIKLTPRGSTYKPGLDTVLFYVGDGVPTPPPAANDELCYQFTYAQNSDGSNKITRIVRPLQLTNGDSVIDFAGYDRLIGASMQTGNEVKDSILNYFVVDCSGRTSWVSVYDIDNDANGGAVSVRVSGTPNIQGTTALVQDDPNEGGSGTFPGTAGQPGGSHLIKHGWAGCCTDGFAIGYTPATDFTFDLDYVSSKGITQSIVFGQNSLGELVSFPVPVANLLNGGLKVEGKSCNEACSTLSTCGDTIEDDITNQVCGYCNTNGGIQFGDANGPLIGTCDDWSYGTCNNYCAKLTSSCECVADPSCGWCSDGQGSGTCLGGDENGATDGTCPATSWKYADVDRTDADGNAVPINYCDPNALCTGTDATCTCKVGYTGDGLTCTELAGCVDANTCVPDAFCNPGAAGTTDHTCTCREGYRGDGVDPNQVATGTGCTPINECAETPDICGPNSICTDLDNGYECSCQDGYFNDAGVCSDIDECFGFNAPNDCVDGPSGQCVNIPGGYECKCAPGYEGDGRVGGTGCTALFPCDPNTEECCNDVDECAAGTHGCPTDTECVNDYGTFSCESIVAFDINTPAVTLLEAGTSKAGIAAKLSKVLAIPAKAITVLSVNNKGNGVSRVNVKFTQSAGGQSYAYRVENMNTQQASALAVDASTVKAGGDGSSDNAGSSAAVPAIIGGAVAVAAVAIVALVVVVRKRRAAPTVLATPGDAVQGTISRESSGELPETPLKRNNPQTLSMVSLPSLPSLTSLERAGSPRTTSELSESVSDASSSSDESMA
eukprot:TRINITY_DN758_c0_g1_i6.p1 TRINITY_DN758_c0_g1~~TRINITY_DN758_c0_g1_i6.p1  ORF type:complete len:1705 (+),score=582.65 TRINITY_DN758_c0_g1_i6:207-5321(+)